MSEIQQRSYTALLEDEYGPHRITLTFYERPLGDGTSETLNEDFELDGEYVSYADLVRQFGRKRVDTFVEKAEREAR